MASKRKIITSLIALALCFGLNAYASAGLFDRPVHRVYQEKSKASKAITIMPKAPTINVGNQAKLTASVQQKPDARINWQVDSNLHVASVDSDGIVTGLKAGTATLRATEVETGRYATVKVVVKNVRVSSVAFSEKSAVVDLNETITIDPPAILPDNATNKTIKWKTSNKKIATVDEEGVVAAVKAGTVTITATVDGKSAKFKLRVRGKTMSVTLSAVGDVVLGGDPRIRSALRRSTQQTFAELVGQYGYDYPFKNVEHVFKADDISFINLEATLTNNTNYRYKTHVLGGPPAYASMLKNASIEMTNLANNHTLDYGESGLKSTQKALDRQKLRWCDFTENGTYTVKKDGMKVKVGFAGFQTPVLTSTIRERVKVLRKKCDVVVVSFHWGDTTEWVARNFPSDRTRSQLAIRAGADLVLGHHRHVPAGIEMYRGKYIVYDLSNFIVGIKHKADSAGRPLTDSMIFQWTFDMDTRGVIEDKGIKVIPCVTTTSKETYPTTDDYGDLGAPINNWQPSIVRGAEGQAIIDRIQALSNVPIPMG